LGYFCAGKTAFSLLYHRQQLAYSGLRIFFVYRGTASSTIGRQR
jgi:hypothetical protein